MALTDTERRNLADLARRTADGQVVELENEKQVAYWRALEERGYARLSTSARSMFETVRGDFVSVTEAGQDALSERA